MKVKQGTRPYIRTILAEMTNRGGKDAEIASKLRTALREGKLQYVLVKAVDTRATPTLEPSWNTSRSSPRRASGHPHPPP